MHSAPSDDAGTFDSPALSRRAATLRLGGGGLALLFASGIISAAAQEASPAAVTAAADRAFLAIRTYQLTPGHTVEELAAMVESGFVPILREVPGFQRYFLVETGDGVAAISVFANQAGADESTQRAADWVQQNLAGYFTGPPAVTTGSVWIEGSGEV